MENDQPIGSSQRGTVDVLDLVTQGDGRHSKRSG